MSDALIPNLQSLENKELFDHVRSLICEKHLYSRDHFLEVAAECKRRGFFVTEAMVLRTAGDHVKDMRVDDAGVHFDE